MQSWAFSPKKRLCFKKIPALKRQGFFFEIKSAGKSTFVYHYESLPN